MRCFNIFRKLFSQSHQSRDMQASVLQRKAIGKVAGGLGVLWESLLLLCRVPSPRGLVPDKGPEDTKAACTGLMTSHATFIQGQ